MLHRLTLSLLMPVTLILCYPLCVEKKVTYSVRGRIVDNAGRQVAGASVFLDSPAWAHQVFGATTDESGKFRLEETTTVPRYRRRLYVAGPQPESAVRLIYPPFNLLPGLTSRVFAGLQIRLEKNKELDIGDVPIQVFYRPVTMCVQNSRGMPELKASEQWKSVYLRLRDEHGSIVTESSLSQNDIEKAVNLAESCFAVSLPEGVWRIELSISGYAGPWLISDRELNVKEQTDPLNLTFRTSLE
jgi:hypothetical protein